MGILRAGQLVGGYDSAGEPNAVDLRRFLNVDEESACFLCLRPLRQLPAIFWKGGETVIAFHPPCARSFLSRLARDVDELLGRDA